MREKLVWKDVKKRVVLRSIVVGHFVMWSVRQSPYLYPEDICKGIGEFDKSLISDTKSYKGGIIEATYTELKDNIRSAIANSDTISSWSIAKKGTGMVFVSAYSEPKPDYDFIDLDALARNIAQSVWLEAFYQDGGFEQQKGGEKNGKSERNSSDISSSNSSIGCGTLCNGGDRRGRTGIP